jgi:hypothetical protein
MYDASNPAGRLHDILHEAVSLKDENQTAQRVWATVFGVDPNDHQTVMAKLVEVYGLTAYSGERDRSFRGS